MRLILAAALLTLASSVQAVQLRDTRHDDGRGTPRAQFEPMWRQPESGASGEALAREFLSARAAEYQVAPDLSNLRFTQAQESLLGVHYRFQQVLSGYDVENAEIIVSIAKSDGRIYRVYNNAYPAKAQTSGPNSVLGEAQGYDLAWQALRAHGEVVAPPSYRTVYVPVNGGFELQAIVYLELSAPMGAWEVRLDAQTGRVISILDTVLERVKTEESVRTSEERIREYSGPLGDRASAFDRWAQAEAAASLTRYDAAARAMGTGVVFDPDPRATLNNATLQDTSPAGSFAGAYLTRNLLDITFNGSVYSLTGPWVNIINFESPNTLPSTTVNGQWTANRGVNSFNDALCYFHIDQNQRYMQSLGFVGATGIQDVSIGLDTDGLSGADNSHYIPGSNRMAFGHGCVDDSEDADVVLHEYGHAIHYGINSNWGGGDAGAMGEGFGDYWAGSYSYSTPNGPTFHPEWVFTWDGHGTPAPCWPGRVLNAFAAQYDPSQTYGAHQSIPGGFQSDELWSTPLFQSLVTLIGMGETREEIDQIVLESHFGIGAGPRMPDLATATVQAAQMLQPAGPHADVFIDKFVAQNILDLPTVSLGIDGTSLDQTGGNGVADPGETVLLTIALENVGTLDAVDVSGDLSTTTPGVSVDVANSAYPDLPIGAIEGNLTAFVLSIDPGFVCGDEIDLSLEVTYEGAARSTAILSLSIGTGVVQGVSQSVAPNLAIPDNNAVGVTSIINVSGTGANVTASFNVDVQITHPYIGDLEVFLRSPANTQVTLHNRTGGSADNIYGNYPQTLTPAGSLAVLIGQPLDGAWSLIVRDRAGQDIGVLDSWGINDIQGYDCEATVGVDDGVEDGVTTRRFSLDSAIPNPFTRQSTLRFAVANTGAVSLDVLDVSGRVVRTLASGALAAGEHAREWDGRDDLGHPVGAGVYFVRLRQGAQSIERKTILIR